MRCYCVTHHGQPLRLIEQPTPEPSGTEVLLKVRAAGLCHSDIHLWEGHYDLGQGKKLQLSDRGIKLPLVMSHEIVGEVVSGAAEVTGNPVLVHPWIGCGTCAACLRDEENLCIQSRFLGVMRPGGFADFCLVPHPRYLVEIDGLDPAEAAPLACAGVTTYSALKKFGSRIHDAPVVIIGAGGLGLMAIAVLKSLGGKGAVVVDLDPAKREAAMAAGALAAVDAKAADAAQQIMALTDGGARAVLDLVGATATVTLGLAASARGGHIVIVGLMGGDITVSLPVIPMRPLTIQGSYVGTLAELRELVALVKATHMPAVPLTRRPLSEVNAALQDLAAGRSIGRNILIP